MKSLSRPSGRKYNESREISIEISPLIYAKHSCLIKYGNTHLLCVATWDQKIPHFLKGKRHGWLTAEYGMLTRCSAERIQRDSSAAKISGRSQEIQRLIARTLRNTLDLNKIPEGQILIDCDVINADGGTRTAAISGGYVALVLLLREMLKMKLIHSIPIKSQIAAISCGIYNNHAILDLDYLEDSNAQADANFIFTAKNDIIEIQAAAETGSYKQSQLLEMLELAQIGCKKIVEIQNLFLSQVCGERFVEELTLRINT